ncbi:WD40-repeat-containing domain protein [Mycena epipterygia]|nr:WD40-repeat-containing domain protein [Mycena epipterygia]
MSTDTADLERRESNPMSDESTVWTSWINNPEPKHISFPAHGSAVVTCLVFSQTVSFLRLTITTFTFTVLSSEGCFIRLMATKEAFGPLPGSSGRTLRIWDLETGRCIHVFGGHNSTVRCLALVEPAWVDVEQDDGSIAKEESPKRPLINQNPLHKLLLEGHTNAVRDLAVHGRTTVSASYDCKVRVWDVISGECKWVFAGHTGKVYSVVLDPVRDQAYSGSMDGTVWIWNFQTGECLASSHLVSAVADATLRVWDPDSGTLIHTLAQHTGAITCFQHNEFKVLSGADGTLMMWGIRDGTVVRKLLAGLTDIWRVVFEGGFPYFIDLVKISVVNLGVRLGSIPALVSLQKLEQAVQHYAPFILRSIFNRHAHRDRLAQCLCKPAIPLELQFLILDQMHTPEREAKVQLRRLASICLAWAMHIQSLLFRHVALGFSDAENFLSLLRGSKHLGKYVTSLALLEGISFNSVEIQALLPNVRTMHVTVHVFQPLTGPRCQWSAVTRLRIKFCVLSTAQDLWDFIGLFPACERLEFLGWMYNDGDPLAGLSTAVDAPAKHLEYLALESSRNHSPQPVARCLAMHNNLSVDHLFITLAAQDDWDASASNMLLSRIGSTLQDLELVELPEQADPSCIVGIRLSPCTTLRSLALNLRFSTASANNMQAGLLSLLQQISSPVLVALSLRMSLTKRLLELPWEVIHTLLAGDCFCNLQRVTFKVSDARIPDEPRLGFDEFEDMMRGVMVDLRRRGLLRFRRYES